MRFSGYAYESLNHVDYEVPDAIILSTLMVVICMIIYALLREY